ncbi:MAG: hypothetical protein J6A46_03085, partial [Clostridia bacterium]|nr:hypothetical protein [Clostridia bacterium]
MSVKYVKTLLENIQSTHGGYDEAEKISAGIIKAAIENGLVEFVRVVDDRNNRYYQFKIVGLDQVYEVCFGFNPPAMGAHSHAERALRSSDFIMTLQGLIDKDYNCYVVPSVDISGPKTEVLRKRIFGENSDVDIQKGQAKRGVGSNVSYRSVYELEVAINAAVDYRGDNGEAKYECVRINDSVVVEANVTDGKLNASYVCKTLDKKEKAESLDNVSIKEDQLLIVKKVLTHVNSNAEKRKILECLASSEESGFYKEFLGNLSNWKDVQVGQVSIKPCFVFVDKIPCKTFDYSVQLGNSLPAFGLKLTWNDLDTRFNEKTPLYIVVSQDGDFEGFTYEKSFEQNGKTIERAEYKDCTLVAAYGKDGKPVLTLAPTNQSDFDIGNDNFKGIKDWAVQLTGVSEKLFFKVGTDNKYSLRSCVRKIEKQALDSIQLCESGVYLESDCAQCDYLDGAPWMWKGDLSEEVIYIDRDGLEREGRIPKKLVEDSILKSCACSNCQKKYYAESQYKCDICQRQYCLGCYEKIEVFNADNMF